MATKCSEFNQICFIPPCVTITGEFFHHGCLSLYLKAIRERFVKITHQKGTCEIICDAKHRATLNLNLNLLCKDLDNLGIF